MVCTTLTLLASALVTGAGGVTHAGASVAARPAVPVSRGQSMQALALSTGTIWDHACFLENLTPKCVALGNSGTIVFTDFEGSNTFSRTLSSSDHNPPVPISNSSSSYLRRHAVVRAAEDTDVRTALAYVRPSAVSAPAPVLSKTSFIAPGTDWTFTFPFTVGDSEPAPLGLGVSRDGGIIVASAYNRLQGKLAIAVFDPSSPVPTAYTELVTFFEPMSFALSADGSTLYVMSQLYTLLYDTQQNSNAYFASNLDLPYGGIAISADGSIFAKSFAGDQRVEIYHKQQGSYSLYATYPSGGLGPCAALAMSDDGKELVAAHANPPLTVTLSVVDLATPMPVTVYQDSIVGDGPYWNSVRDLAISQDGATFAVGLTGSLSGIVPQVQAYGRDPLTQTWSNLMQATLRGSAMDVDLSADGGRVAVASLRGHLDAPLGGGEISLHQVRPRDLVLENVPEPGAQVSFHYAPSPTPNVGAAVVLLTAPQLGNHPTVFPNVGTLYLDRQLTHSAGIGHIGADGVATVDLILPAGGAAIGTTDFYQAMLLAPRRLSQSWIRLTIVP